MPEAKAIDLLIALPEERYSDLDEWLANLQHNIKIAVRSWCRFNPTCTVLPEGTTYQISRGHVGHFKVTVRYLEQEEQTVTVSSDLAVLTLDALKALVRDLEQKIAANNP
jgi:hypothetical protein